MPSNQLPAAGTRVTGSLMAKAVPGFAYKITPTSIASSTVLTADPDLAVAVNASAVYEVAMVIFYNGGTNGASDAQFTLTAPTGSAGNFLASRVQISGLTYSSVPFAPGTAFNAGTNGTGVPMGCYVRGVLVTGGTAGSLTFAWAQNTSNATATTVSAYSFLSARQAI